MGSVRLRLLVLALLPLVVLMPLVLGVAMLRWIDRLDDLLIAEVASDLRIAEQHLARLVDETAAGLDAVAGSVALAEAADPATVLEAARADLRLDFVIRRAPAALPAPARALFEATPPGEAHASLAVLTAPQLAAIAPDLVDAARLDLVPTPAARPDPRRFETRGMVLLALHRALGAQKVMLGGRLLNNDLGFIDEMNALIYRGKGERTGRIGTTTLFLDDVRVSTNVRLFEGSRALGTRVSEVVWHAVMETGRTWLDSAFVVNDWYLSGYMPIENVAGTRIGMLYTGFLEAPSTAPTRATMLWLVTAFLIVIALSVPIFLRLARGVFRPLEAMTATMRRVEKGEIDARIGTMSARDEIGQVAHHLDRLLDQVEDRDAALRTYNDRLSDMVEDRTEELRDANAKLEATFRKLVVTEKLATIGEITAGVAHEINNPVAVIQGNLEVLRAEMGETAAIHATELDLIDAQTHRIRVIVGKLLDFARSDESAEVTEAIDLREAVDGALVLVAPDLRKNDIDVTRHHHVATPVRANAAELQQVLVNLLINAAQAMAGCGSIHIETRPAMRDRRAGAEISIADTGPGIPQDRLASVFDPFYTTKPAEGTGLGLSISRTLIDRVAGEIEVANRRTGGAEFTVWLPLDDPDDPSADAADGPPD